MAQNVRSLRCGAALLIIAQALSAGAAQAQIADPVLFDGKVLTGDMDFSVREALAIDHGCVLAVLSADYMTVPVKDVGRIRSVLTMVGGRIVFADEPYAGFDVP